MEVSKMNKFIMAFGGVLVGSLLIISQAHADNSSEPMAADEINKACLVCNVTECRTEMNICMRTDGCPDVVQCLRDCAPDQKCATNCISHYPENAMLSGTILFKCQVHSCRKECFGE
jgi:hypothetical protein